MQRGTPSRPFPVARRRGLPLLDVRHLRPRRRPCGLRTAGRPVDFPFRVPLPGKVVPGNKGPFPACPSSGIVSCSQRRPSSPPPGGPGAVRPVPVGDGSGAGHQRFFPPPAARHDLLAPASGRSPRPQALLPWPVFSIDARPFSIHKRRGSFFRPAPAARSWRIPPAPSSGPLSAGRVRSCGRSGCGKSCCKNHAFAVSLFVPKLLWEKYLVFLVNSTRRA